MKKTNRKARKDRPLLKQFKEWALPLMRVNPDYVRIPDKLRGYIRGPNWDNPDCEYAHYRRLVATYGAELLELMERMRADGDEGAAAVEEYRALLREAGVEEATA